MPRRRRTDSRRKVNFFKSEDRGDFGERFQRVGKRGLFSRRLAQEVHDTFARFDARVELVIRAGNVGSERNEVFGMLVGGQRFAYFARCLQLFGRGDMRGDARDGTEYVDSWVEANYDRCFQLVKCDDPSLLQQWVMQWQDLVEFEFIPVVPSKDAWQSFK